MSRWAEGGGTPGHLIMGGGVVRKKTSAVYQRWRKVTLNSQNLLQLAPNVITHLSSCSAAKSQEAQYAETFLMPYPLVRMSPACSWEMSILTAI